MDKLFFQEIGEYFKNKRIEKNLTLAEVGDKVGCTAQYICNIENGRSLASWEKIAKLLKTYNIKQNDYIEVLTKVQKAQWKRELAKANSN